MLAARKAWSKRDRGRLRTGCTCQFSEPQFLTRLPPTPVNYNMLAALLFLTAPYAAAEIINLDKGSQGSCYDGTTHVVRRAPQTRVVCLSVPTP